MAKLTMKVKNGMWCGYFYYHDKTQKTAKQKWISSGLKEKGNKTQATEICKQKMEDFLAEIERMENVKDKTLLDFTIWEYADRYIERNEPTIRNVTKRGYMSSRNIIKEFFKDKKLIDTTENDIIDFYNYKRKQGTSTNTIKHYAVLLQATFDLAIHERVYTGINPVKPDKNNKKDLRKLKVPKPTIEVLNPNEQQKLFNIIKGTILEMPFLIAIYYGIRRGEVAALEIKDFDFEGGVLNITKSLDCKNISSMIMGDPKGGEPRQQLLIESLNKRVLQFIQNRETKKVEWDKDKMLYKIPFNMQGRTGTMTFDPLFRHTNGELLTPEYITHKFRKLLIENNFQPLISWNDLRKTCASNLTSDGNNLEFVKDYLGHKAVDVTIKHYATTFDAVAKKQTKTYGNKLDKRFDLNAEDKK